jgi:hypothetical protein
MNNNAHTSRVHFESSQSSPSQQQEAIHINAMFQTNGNSSSNNNHTDSAQQGPPSSSQNLPSYVPNKYSAHHDPSMPDWEGITIAERTMADISTLSPPPDDYYNPYTSPPVAMIAAASPGTPWEELEETDAERADWRNPTYTKENSTLGSGVEQGSALQPRDRKLIWGLMVLVGLLVVVVAVAVPLSIKAVNGGGSKVVGQENALVTTSPTMMPVSGGGGTTDDSVDIDGVITTEPKNTTGVPSLATTTSPELVWETTPPSSDNGREETKVPTPAPIATTLEPSIKVEVVTESPSNNNEITSSTPEPTIATTPEPTPEPTPKPSTSSPTPSPSSSLLNSNLGETPLAWLSAHNTRRQYYHESVYGSTYIPLIWSESLASSAQEWAETENDGSGCSVDTQGSDAMGQTGYAYWTTKNDGMDSPEDVLSWWVDDMEGLDYPDNKKFTQAVWRASKVCLYV